MGISPQDCSCSTDNRSNPAEGFSGMWKHSDYRGLNQESGWLTALERTVEVLTTGVAGRGGKVVFAPPFQPLAETPL